MSRVQTTKFILAATFAVMLGAIGGHALRAEAADSATTAAVVTSGAIPLTSDGVLFVFGGGSTQDLVSAAGCTAPTVAEFWAQTAAGDFVRYQADAEASSNAEWLAQFGGGLPTPVAVFGRCR